MKNLFGKKTSQPPSDYTAVLDLDAGPEELAPGLQNLYSPQVTAQTRIRDVADVLRDEGQLTTEQFDAIRGQQQQSGAETEKLLAEQGLYVNPDELAANDYRYARAVITDVDDMTAGLVAGFAFLEARYKQTTMISATASASA